MISKSVYKLSMYFILIMGLLTFGIDANVGAVNSWYNTERETEERENEEDKAHIETNKIRHVVAKGKSVPLYDFQVIVKDKISATFESALDIFFKIETEPSTVRVVFPILTNISPRYILYRCLIFYC